ncbi:MAG: RNA polymerase-binding protein RbpA [Micrococcales bacterium]|nr:RNA polymerase-binding protein RbpA [Micrococcales bacterium]
MAERSMRGVGLGCQSLESKEGVKWAERLNSTYDCPAGHVIILPLFVEAVPPDHWQCRCGRIGHLRGLDRTTNHIVKRQRTHWDMLLERRSVEELEALLEERLELLRSGRLPATTCY